jgi:hypothetical protein
MYHFHNYKDKYVFAEQPHNVDKSDVNLQAENL